MSEEIEGGANQSQKTKPPNPNPLGSPLQTVVTDRFKLPEGTTQLSVFQLVGLMTAAMQNMPFDSTKYLSVSLSLKCHRATDECQLVVETYVEDLCLY